MSEGLRAAGLGERDRSPVACFLRSADERWRDCCGSDCDPCAILLARAVLAARGIARADLEPGAGDGSPPAPSAAPA